VHDLATDAGRARSSFRLGEHLIDVLVFQLRQLGDHIRIPVVVVRGDVRMLDGDGHEGGIQGSRELDRAQRCLPGRR
jgi:hypothetical protein